MGKVCYVTTANIATWGPYGMGLGDHVFYNTNHNNGEFGLYVIQSGSHNEKNFSLGIGCDGWAANDNYNSIGELKYLHGGTGNYNGPIGDKCAFIYPDTTATVVSDMGDALFTKVAHGLSTGWYIWGKGYTHYGAVNAPAYSGYRYVEVLTANTFKLKETSASPTYLQFVSGQTSLIYSITIGACKMTGMDVIGSASQPVIITNAGGQAIFRKKPDSVASYCFEFFNGADYFHHTGKYNPKLGTGDANYIGKDGGYKYGMGKDGMWFIHGNELTNNPILYYGGGSRHFETDYHRVTGFNHGFAGIMAKRDNSPADSMDIKIHDCIVTHVHGEGFYLGYSGRNTENAPAEQHSMKVHAYNNVIEGTGVEGCQKGHNVEGSIFENNVFAIPSLTRLNPFHPGQNNLTQQKDLGNTVISRNNIQIGGCVNVDLYQCDRADTPGTTHHISQNNLLINGLGRVAYFDFGNANGQGKLSYINCYIKNVLPYDTDRSMINVDYENGLFHTVDTNAILSLRGVKFDSGMSSKTMIVTGIAANRNFANFEFTSLPDPEFVCSGFDGIDTRHILIWIPTYKPNNEDGFFGHPTYPGQAVHYTTLDYTMRDGRLYHCIVDHNAVVGVPPEDDPTNWEQVFWDEAGQNSLHPNYDGVPYSWVSPGDWRLKANSFYNKKGIGLLDNEPNTDSTYFLWQGAYNNGGVPDESFIKTLHRFKTKAINETDALQEMRANDFVRRIRMKNGTTPITTGWVQLT